MRIINTIGLMLLGMLAFSVALNLPAHYGDIERGIVLITAIAMFILSIPAGIYKEDEDDE